MAYRCVATSVAGFVQQLAVAYVAHGYWFYVTGWIPQGKPPEAIDRKLIERKGQQGPAVVRRLLQAHDTLPRCG